jgi:adenylate cyclase
VERRLAAILAADIVGYTKLMSEDEASTLSALRQLRHDLLAPSVTKHRGNLIKSMGDGWLIEFPSAGDAVTCAIKIQEALAHHEAVKLRVGLHVGDVTFEDEDIYGDGVNIAARLQELSDPGAVVISDFARLSIDGKLAGKFKELGPQSLKNISEPVLAYGYGMSESLDSFEAPHSFAGKPSIAVLPFTNMSGDPEQEYFSDGLTEDIITELARYTSLKVISRSSSFTFRGDAVDIKVVGKDLGASYVLEGSVRKSGNHVRITAQLIEVKTGAHIWAERYDRGIEDIFSVQDEITLHIAGALIPQLTENELDRVRRMPPKDMSIQEKIWKEMWHFERFTPEDFASGTEILNEVLDNDENYAMAHSYIAMIYNNSALMSWGKNPEELVKKAIFHAGRSIECDKNNPFGYLAMATALLVAGQADKGVELARTALNLTPSLALGYFLLSGCEGMSGDPVSAKQHLETAIELSPKDPWMFYLANNMSLACYQLKEYDEAAEWAQKSINLVPNFVFGHFNLVAALGQLDQAKAKQALSRALEINPKPTQEFVRQGWPYQKKENAEHLFEGFRKAGLFE